MRYTKSPQIDTVILPGVGKLKKGQILEGSEFAQFAPKYLIEVPDQPTSAPLESTEPSVPGLITEPNESDSRPVPNRVEKLEERKAKTSATKKTRSGSAAKA